MEVKRSERVHEEEEEREKVERADEAAAVAAAFFPSAAAAEAEEIPAAIHVHRMRYTNFMVEKGSARLYQKGKERSNSLQVKVLNKIRCVGESSGEERSAERGTRLGAMHVNVRWWRGGVEAGETCRAGGKWD